MKVFIPLLFTITFIQLFCSPPITQMEDKSHNQDFQKVKQIYTCPMHPEIKQEKPGICPICEMPLVPLKQKEEATPLNQKEEGKQQIYTCSMHPEIRQNQPGNCPICGMKLIPLKEEKEITISEDQLPRYGIKLGKVKKINAIKTIPIVGNFEYDERNLCKVSAKFSGWVQKLYMNFEGAYIQKNHKLALVYSNQLSKLHTELLLYKSNLKEYKESFSNTIKHFLHLGLSKKEVKRLLRLKKPTYYFWLDSPCEGIISKKHIFKDSYINEGDILYEILNTKKMWFVGRLYESDIEILNFVTFKDTLYRCPMHHFVINKQPGICKIQSCQMPLVPFNPDLSITIKHPLLEGGKYSDYIELLYPEVEEQTRTIKFRVTVPNPHLLLQKGMFAQAEITFRRKDVLVVPETAVVFTGDSEFVFIFRDNKIVPRKIIIGQRYLESENSSENTFLIPYKLRYFEILEGLEEGDTIITSGTFLIDAESQLRKIITEETQDSQQTPHQHNH